MSSETFAAPTASNQTAVFAVHGADTEVLAFAMAKYSRSSLSMRESLTEISAQRAEQFLNTFYFQYGHRSIADLAHIAFAVERLSLLAAIVLVDEQRWDGQERSTRYQNFLKSGWYFPDFGADAASAQLYTSTVENLFATYQRTTAAVLEVLRGRIACPDTLKPEAYERTLKARAFDVARYLLPLATNTSLGQIVSARTLETQVSRLLSHPAAEVRDLGVKLREAATGTAWTVQSQAAAAFADRVIAADPSLAPDAAHFLTREVKTAPTLVKYAQPSAYEIESRQELAQAAAQLLSGVSCATAPLVDLVERTETLEVELASGALVLVAQPAGRGPVSHPAHLHGAVAVPGPVLHALAGGRSAAAEDDGLHDAALLRVHHLDLLLRAGAVLVGGQPDRHRAAGSDEPHLAGPRDARGGRQARPPQGQPGTQVGGARNGAMPGLPAPRQYSVPDIGRDAW